MMYYRNTINMIPTTNRTLEHTLEQIDCYCTTFDQRTKQINKER